MDGDSRYYLLFTHAEEMMMEIGKFFISFGIE
jgi:hypothetical protein